ncbi:alpha/beta hydrolase [Streptosporangium lutulentum]|uniref:Acetyl esterase/lipase n=1 Tax=Streptosporangium lutulentum TaxID=1461250 RepID=A0ABT9Q4E0_9ACTN|nr:alpha/beta hydrolase [Streptosporangium lutulentum]MDP9841600.1 acetyl esterase/lipase [Streptosporangium lutulentum]
MTQDQRSAARAMMTKGDLGRTPAQQRAEFDGLFAERPLGDDITLTPRTLGGVPALDVQVEGADGDAVIFYLHGGGYVVGSARTGAGLAAPLARRTGLPAVSLDYRLAPENPFPAAIDDALAAYRELLGTGRRIVIAGESAGGGLALATMLAARRDGLPLPVAAALFSPWTDLTLSGVSLDSRGDADPLFSRAHMEEYAEHYLAGHDPKDELASPLLADLTGLPPLLIQVGSAEVLLDDSLRLAVRAAEHEVDVSLNVVAGAPHVYPLMAGVMDEADQAFDHAARFLGDAVA